MASPVKDAAWLEWMAGLMGVGSRQKQTAILPPQQFHCLLDELPLHLIPRRAFDRLKAKSCLREPLILNPNCSFLPAGEVPAELDFSDLRAGFCLQKPMAWVREASTDALQPFWLGPRFEAVVSGLKPGELVPPSVSDETKLILAMAGILIGANQVGALENPADFSRNANAFRETNYTPVGDVLHPFHVAALRRYYRQRIRAGAISLGDEQSSRRYVAHNEPVARFFHRQIVKVMSAIVGEPVKPSYVYLASYLPGAELKKHTDREQCEFSMTLCLDFSPEPKLATSWPICVDTPGGTVTIFQALGDGLIYRGTKVPHFRSALKDGFTSTSIFFHFVPVDFGGPLD